MSTEKIGPQEKISRRTFSQILLALGIDMGSLFIGRKKRTLAAAPSHDAGRPADPAPSIPIPETAESIDAVPPEMSDEVFREKMAEIFNKMDIEFNKDGLTFTNNLKEQMGADLEENEREKMKSILKRTVLGTIQLISDNFNSIREKDNKRNVNTPNIFYKKITNITYDYDENLSNGANTQGTYNDDGSISIVVTFGRNASPDNMYGDASNETFHTVFDDTKLYENHPNFARYVEEAMSDITTYWYEKHSHLFHDDLLKLPFNRPQFEKDIQLVLKEMFLSYQPGLDKVAIGLFAPTLSLDNQAPEIKNFIEHCAKVIIHRALEKAGSFSGTSAEAALTYESALGWIMNLVDQNYQPLNTAVSEGFKIAQEQQHIPKDDSAYNIPEIYSSYTLNGTGTVAAAKHKFTGQRIEGPIFEGLTLAATGNEKKSQIDFIQSPATGNQLTSVTLTRDRQTIPIDLTKVQASGYTREDTFTFFIIDWTGFPEGKLQDGDIITVKSSQTFKDQNQNPPAEIKRDFTFTSKVALSEST